MAWSDVLQNLMGMQQLSQNRAEASRGRRLQYDAMANATRSQARQDKQDWWADIGNRFAGIGQNVGNQFFQAAEADKDRGIREDQLQFQKDVFADEQAQRQNYVYQNEDWPLPGGGTIKMSSDNEVDHDRNLRNYKSLVDAWERQDERAFQERLMQLRSGNDEGTGKWGEAIWTGREELVWQLQQAGLVDQNNNKMPGMTEEEYNQQYNDILSSTLSDSYLSKVLSDNGLEANSQNVQELRNLIAREANVPQPPGEETVRPERTPFSERVAGSGLAAGLGRADEAIGNTLLPLLGQSTTQGEAPGLTRADDESGIFGDLENRIFDTIQMLTQSAQVTPEDMRELQGIYQIILGPGLKNTSRAERKDMLDIVQEMLNKYGM